MNICIVSREVYPYQKAGIAVYVHNLCRLLKRKGHQVYLITPEERLSELEEFEGIHIVPLQPMGVILNDVFTNYNLNYSYQVYQTLKTLSETVSLDIVEFSDYFGEGYFSFLAKKKTQFLTHIPFVVKCHGPLYECLLNNTELIQQNQDILLQEDYCIRETQHLSVVSQALGDILKQRLSLTKPLQVLLNPLAIDTLQTSRYSRGSEKTLLYVGRIQYLKGVDLLIQSAVDLLQKGHDFKVVLVGQDVEDYVKTLQEMIPDDLQEQFIFTGRLEREDVLTLYNAAYLSVFPSRWEGLSNVAIESILQGCPILTSDVGGLGGIHNYGAFGRSFENGNLAQLTKELEHFLSNEDFRQTCSETCSTDGGCFLDEQVYQTTIDFYQTCIDELYQVVIPRQMTQVLYDNFNQSLRLNQELHQEVLRLNEVAQKAYEELAEVYVKYEELNRVHWDFKVEHYQFKESVEQRERVQQLKMTNKRQKNRNSKYNKRIKSEKSNKRNTLKRRNRSVH